eukprot:9434403-Pyramimonas_sp.AAC.1
MTSGTRRPQPSCRHAPASTHLESGSPVSSVTRHFPKNWPFELKTAPGIRAAALGIGSVTRMSATRLANFVPRLSMRGTLQ